MNGRDKGNGEDMEFGMAGTGVLSFYISTLQL